MAATKSTLKAAKDKACYMGIDLGFGYVKAYADGDQFLQFPSIAVEYQNMDILNKKDLFEYKDKQWLVGESAKYVHGQTRKQINTSYVFTPQYEVLMAYAIEQLKTTNNVFVTGGLAVDFYEQYNNEMKEAFENQFKKIYKDLVSSYLTLPQPYGTFEYLLNDPDVAEQYPDLQESKVAIIDIGHGTIDGVSFVKGEYRASSSRGREAGVLVALTQVKEHISSKYGKTLSDVETMDAIKKGSVKVEGKTRQLKVNIKDAKNKRVDTVKALVNDDMDGMINYDYIVISGGGALFLEEELRKVISADQLIIPKEPDRANAKGFYRVAKANMG